LKKSGVKFKAVERQFLRIHITLDLVNPVMRKTPDKN